MLGEAAVTMVATKRPQHRARRLDLTPSVLPVGGASLGYFTRLRLERGKVLVQEPLLTDMTTAFKVELDGVAERVIRCDARVIFSN